MKRDLTKGRGGFTLIELLVVVVILGVLAAVAMVRTGTATREARRSSIVADLKLVTLHQEIFHNLNLRYGTLPELEDYETGPGVTVVQTWLDTNGFALTGSHVGAPGLECGYFIGPAPAGSMGPATVPGQITCN